MPKTAKILSARAVSELRWDKTTVDKSGNPLPTSYSVGGAVGLYIQCTKDGGKSWFYRYSSIEGDGKRIPMGLGGYTYKSLKDSDALTLQQAREKAQHWAGVRANGLDPISEREKSRQAVIAKKAEGIVFMDVAEEWMTFMIESNAWNDAATISRARAYMDDYCYPIIGNVAILDIKYSHVLKILSQKTLKGRPHMWNDSNDTGVRLRRYIFEVIARGLATLGKQQTVFNVATLKNNLDKDLGKSKNLHQVKHRPSVPVDNLPEFISRLIKHQSLAPKGGRPDIDCFIFGMLSCTRSECSREADWEDIDLAKKLWIVPPEKVGKKTKKTWHIPLHPRAIKIIQAQPSGQKKKGRIFSTLNNRVIPDAYLSKLPKILGIKDTDGRLPVFHGMRKTMNNWAKKARWSKDTRELMMQHLEESSTHAAYDNEQMIDDRREIVTGYEEYAFSMVTSSNVALIKRNVS
jgi:integrase